jgi:hypothetical protein
LEGKPPAPAVRQQAEPSEWAANEASEQAFFLLGSARRVAGTDGPALTVVEIELPAGWTSEQAIARLTAAADVVLVTDSRRRKEVAANLQSRDTPNDERLDQRRAAPGDALVMDLDAVRAERFLATLSSEKSKASSAKDKADSQQDNFGAEAPPARNGAARFAAPLAKLETDLDAVPSAAGAEQVLEPAAAPAIAARAPGLPEDGNRASQGGAFADKLFAAKPAGPAESWAVVVPREELSQLLLAAAEKKQASFGQAAASGDLGPGGAAADLKPRAAGAGREAGQGALPALGASSKAASSDRRRLVILLRAAETK